MNSLQGFVPGSNQKRLALFGCVLDLLASFFWLLFLLHTTDLILGCLIYLCSANTDISDMLFNNDQLVS